MKLTAFCIALLFMPLAAFSQLTESNEALLSGTVVDGTGTPLPSASVAIYDSSMTEIITGTPTEANGDFRVEVDPGSYVVKITFISYQPHQQGVVLSAGEEQSLGTISMESAIQTMDELVVRAEESRMFMSFDKRVFRVGQDIVSMGGSALNVLNNVPSIVTDIDGNISLRGNSSVRVLINGKPSNLVGDDVSALRGIPAGQIMKVEIMTNPSAKYSAEGSGGIINIVMKKEEDRGFNGSFNVSGGYPEYYGAGTNLNYRVNDINLFFNGSVNYRSSPEEGGAFQRFASPDTAYMYREVEETTESEFDVDLRFGADFFLTENQTLTASTYMQLENGEENEDVTFTDYAYEEGTTYTDDLGNVEVIRKVFRDKDEDSDEREFGFDLEYENLIDGNDHKLTAEADLEFERESELTNVTERIGEASPNSLMQRIDNSQEATDFRAEAEYVRPLGQDGKLEAGVQTSFDWLKNDYQFKRYENGSWETVPAFNNNFIFNENVNAAYIILGKEWGAFSGQVGLRVENTRIHAELKGTDQENEQNYTNLFPSIFLNYAFNEQQSVQVSYSRRLNRPWSRMLLPFTDYSDTRSRFSGNPNLSPEYSNSFEAGYLQYWGSGSLLTSFYYRHRTNMIEHITTLNEEGFSLRFPINLATEDAWGIEFSADQDIMEGFTLTANANFYTAQSEGSYEGKLLTSDTQTFQTRFGIRWNINNLWNFQASARYRAPRETTQGERSAMTFISSGLARDLFDGNATLSLSVRDLLNSRNYEYTITDDGNPVTDFYAHREFRWSSRSFRLTFTYHFNQPNKPERNRGGGMPRR